MDDESETLVPIVEFCIHNINIHLIKFINKLRVNGHLVIASSFYNIVLSGWEPFIEKYGIQFNVIKQTKNPQLGLTLITHPDYEDLNFNFSDQMVYHLFFI